MAAHFSRGFGVALLQLNTTDNISKNFSRTKYLISKAAKRAKLILLPENCFWRGGSKELRFIAATETPKYLQQAQQLAQRLNIYLLLGSVLQPSPNKAKYFNTSILISPAGKMIAKYQKIHLFDTKLASVRTRESDHIAHGRNIVTAHVARIPVGLTICYDLRFPELFRKLTFKKCRIIFVPANFTYQTGKAHWKILLRARAIENQCFVLAPAQTGKNPVTGLKAYGHSLIIDPWGKVVAEAGNREGILYAYLDFKSQEKLRSEFPVLKHCRISA